MNKSSKYSYDFLARNIMKGGKIMAKLTAAQAAEKWNRRLKASTADMQTGIENVTEAPGKKAAKKAQKMLQNITESVNNGTWAARVSAVTLEEWKTKMLNKGVGRVAAGADEAVDDVQSFYDQLFTHQDTIAKKLETMPDLNLEDNIQRMTTYIREMSKFKRTK